MRGQVSPKVAIILKNGSALSGIDWPGGFRRKMPDSMETASKGTSNMDRNDTRLCQLPKRRTALRLEWLASLPLWGIGAVGLLLYVVLVATISGAEWASFHFGISRPWVCTSGEHRSVVQLSDIAYFNCISVLTIGYGDFVPSGGWARLVTVLEAILGSGILGMTIAALTAKFSSPPQNAIVFSRFAYYCTEDRFILIIFVNTCHSRLVNAEMSSYFKLGGDWVVRPSIRSPLVTGAVQTFFTDRLIEEELVQRFNDKSDVFRFGISGLVGGASVSVAIEYEPADILVIANRTELINFQGFWADKVDFQSSEFRKMFHYQPPDSKTLLEYIKDKRAPPGMQNGA